MAALLTRRLSVVVLAAVICNGLAETGYSSTCLTSAECGEGSICTLTSRCCTEALRPRCVRLPVPTPCPCAPPRSPMVVRSRRPTRTPVTPRTGTPRITPTPDPSNTCLCDCDGDRVVGIDDLIRRAQISLGNLPVESCPIEPSTGIGDLIRCVRVALQELCPAIPMPTPTQTLPPSPTHTIGSSPTQTPILCECRDPGQCPPGYFISEGRTLCRCRRCVPQPPTPQVTHPGLSEPTPSVESQQWIFERLDDPAKDICKNPSVTVSGQGDRYFLHCDTGRRGHMTSMQLTRHASAEEAAVAFAVRQGAALEIGGFPAVFRWRDDPRITLHDQEYGELAWQPGCWFVSAVSFDDTWYRGVDARELARTVADHALTAMLMSCPR